MKFSKYVEKADVMVDELANELGYPGDHKLAGRLLRSVLHVLRDRLTIEESFQLISQLPLMIKGLYVEGWKYGSTTKKIKTTGEFIRAVIKEDFPAGHHDIFSVKDGENVIRAVFNILKKHVSQGEVEDVIAVMPKNLKPLWGEMQEK